MSDERKPLDRDFDCCPVLALVLERSHPSFGIQVATYVDFKTGDFRYRVVEKFRKAKKGDGSQYAAATYAAVQFCPFCGAPGCKRVDASTSAGVEGSSSNREGKEPKSESPPVDNAVLGTPK